MRYFRLCLLLSLGWLPPALAQPAIRIIEERPGPPVPARRPDAGPPPQVTLDSVRVLADTAVVEYSTLRAYPYAAGTAEPNVYIRRWRRRTSIHSPAQSYVRDCRVQRPGLLVRGLLIDSVRVLSDTTAVEYARLRTGPGGAPGTPFRYELGDQAFGRYPRLDARAYALQTKRTHPEAVVVGYTIPADSLPRAREQPELKKRKARRKKSALLPAAPLLPGAAVAAVAVGLLVGAGWVLGRRGQRARQNEVRPLRGAN